ncbi:Signal transduction histidine kinase [Rhodovulum sp. P5]|uniref:PAS domain-containing hybrid sensor histidine kinase/response regulator n=1 Tax=Rhodovulum sp. P5 TaxID=1564506 RepID=UPI0009C283B0|nr:PAS-domain containing protein [Rhodovulum sp. P5]ARE39105.1 Signal transduction histidine kinase [Rhodovulum sp. P5]
MIDPSDPPEVTIAKQAKIIDALIRRASRQHEVGSSAYALFQSAIALQGQVWAKTRDLERTFTELEIARDDRERTQKRLTEALESMEGGFALFIEGRLQACNGLFKSVLPDISARLLPGLALADYFRAVQSSRHLADPEKACRDLATAIRGPADGASLSFVIEFTGDRWYQISQKRTQSDNIVLLLTEITDVVRMNRQEKDLLIDMQAHYLQAAFDHMSLGICTFSRAGGVTVCNGRFRELLGLPYMLVQPGSPFAQILRFVKDNRLIAAADIVDIDDWPVQLRKKGRLRKRLRHAGGRVLDLQVHRLPDGGFMVYMADITLETRATEVLEKRVEERTAELTEANRLLRDQHAEQARVEDALREAKTDLEAAMSSKTRFLAAASHDLLQPINAAKLLISTLAERTRGTDLAPTADRLAGSFSSMEGLLHSLLDISRLESTGAELTPGDFCLGEIMRAVADDYGMVAAQKGIDLRVVPCAVWVRSDRQFLMRSLQNLVVNAIQYTENGRVLVGARRRGDRILLQVWDTGIGISPADQARVFQEFARAGNAVPGTGMGLGLSIVDRTCRHLGHVLSVQSEPGRGSVFSIEIERAETQAPCPQVSEACSGDISGPFDLIALIVENDPDVLFATTETLERWGASVLGALSTKEALGLVDDLGMPPDIILADYQLEGTDTGLAAIRAVRARTGAAVPAIMITANRSPDLLRTATQDDFTVMTKPVDVSRLRPLIDWKTRRQNPATDESLP